MSVIYQCDRCTIPLEPEQAGGYRLEIAGFQIVLRPEGHLCPHCVIALLQRAAEASTVAQVTTGLEPVGARP